MEILNPAMGSPGLSAGQFSLCLLLVASCFSASSGKKCGRFEFLNKGQALIVAEGASVAIHFRLKTEGCELPTSFAIQVSKPASGGLRTYLCKFRHENGACTTAAGSQGCNCPKEPKGWYTFQRKKVKIDENTFTWTTESDDIGEEASFSLKIMPGSLTLSGQSDNYTAEKGDDVEIVCSLGNGNPPMKPRLLDGKGNELGHNNGGQIRHTLPNVSCKDAGLIQCQAAETSLNKTALLLVKGPPEISYFNATYPSGQDADLKFRVCAHNETVQSCHLRRPSVNGIADVCNGRKITGILPDLTLTVRLSNVSNKDKGEWMLELTNDAGTGSVKFEVAVIDYGIGVNSSISATSNSGHSMDVGLLGGIIVSVNIGTVIIVVIVVVIIVRRARRRRQSSTNEVELAPAISPPPLVARAPAVPARPGCSVHVYDDIRGEQPKGYMALDYPPPPPPGRKSKRSRDREVPPPIPPRD